MKTIIELLSDFTPIDISDERLRARGKSALIDCFGCMLAGVDEPTPRLVREYISRRGSESACTVWGRPTLRADACAAGLANGAAASAKDFDDVSPSLHGHVSAVTLPAALAVGEQAGSSGAEILAAYISGVELCCRLARALYAGGYSRNFQSTNTIGIFGAAASASLLLGLDEEQRANAFGLAAGESCAVKAIAGTPAKDFTNGNTVSKGILAAEMARRGLRCNPRIMEASDGFLQVAAGGVDLGRFYEELRRERYELLSPGLVFKIYPSCRGLHNGVDAMLRLVEKNDLRVENIQKILCKVAPSVLQSNHFPNPSSPEQGKFSLSYNLAVALHDRRAELEQFSGASVRPEISALMRLIQIEEFSKAPSGKNCAELTVCLKNGEFASERVDFAKGSPENPLSDGELRDKFIRCVSDKVARPQELRELLLSLDSLPKLDELIALSRVE